MSHQTLLNPKRMQIQSKVKVSWCGTQITADSLRQHGFYEYVKDHTWSMLIMQNVNSSFANVQTRDVTHKSEKVLGFEYIQWQKNIKKDIDTCCAYT